MAPTRAHACNDRPETKTLWLGGSVRTHLCPSFVGIGKSRVMTQVRETKKCKQLSGHLPHAISEEGL